MQLLASMNNSEQWQSVLSNCQLDQWAKTDNKNDNLQNLEKTVPFCVTSALTLTELADLLANAEVNIILSLDSPEYAIGLLLQQGKSTSEALDIWQKLTISILDLQHKHRRQLQLIQTEGLLINPDKAPEWLAKSITHIDSSSFLLARSNIYHLFADQALRQHTEAERCRQRLIACSLPLLDQPLTIFNIDELQHEYVVSKDLQLASSNEEKNLLQEQLFHVQETLEQQLQKNQLLSDQAQQNEEAFATQKQQLSELQSQLESSKQEQTKSQQLLTVSNEENALILDQLFHVQETLEQQLQKNQLLSDQVQQNEEAFATQKQQLSELQSQLEISKQDQAKSKQQLSELQSQLEISKQDQAKSKQQLSELQSQLEISKQDRAKSKQQLSELQSQLESSKQDQAKSKQQLSELQNQLEISKQDRAKSKQQLSDLQSQLEISKKDQAKSQQQLIASNEENDLVLQQLFYVQEELEQRLLSNQELAQQHTKLEVDYRNNTAAFLAKYQKSERAVATAKQQSREAQEQLLACTEENEQLRKQLSELKQVHQQSLQNLTELEKQLHASKQEEVLTKHKLASAQIDLTAVKGSRLWKSVSPVRKLVSAFKSSKAREQLQHNAALITGSEYFDLAWYLHRYPDVVESGVNPAEHYLIFGADEGRSPGPLFDGNWYLSQYPDVAENNTNPLLHYILFGAQEGRAISPRLLQHLADPSEVNSVDEKSSNQDTKAAD